jgi:DNA-binding HxlR family transcriptional regulator
MTEKHNKLCFCPVKGVIDIISKKWALFIINALGNNGKLRFNDLMKALESVSPKTLSDTLKALQTEGLITRVPFAEIPPRVEYSLTPEGTELREAILPLLMWTAARKSTPNYSCGHGNKPCISKKINS